MTTPVLVLLDASVFSHRSAMTILTLIAGFHTEPRILRLLWSNRILDEYYVRTGYSAQAHLHCELLRSGFEDATDWLEPAIPLAEHPIERHVIEAVANSTAEVLLSEEPETYSDLEIGVPILRCDQFLVRLIRGHRRTITMMLREKPPVQIGFDFGMYLPNFRAELE